MDENVIFPPKQDSGQDPAQQDAAETVQAPAGEAAPEAPPVDPAVPVEETPPADGEPAAEVPADGGVPPETPPEDGEVPAEEPPPSRAGLIKKILIGLGILIVIIFLVVLLIPKNQEPKEVTLEWWGLWEDARAVQPAIDDFERVNPNITIKYVMLDPKQYREKLTTRIQNGTGPDIFRYHNSWVPMISNVLLPLSSDVISPEEFKKAYPPVMQTDLTKNGAIYGIPLDADTLGMFANTELFETAGMQVPSTWEEFVTTSRRLTVKDAETGKIKTAGAALGRYGNVTHASDIVSMLFVQQGIDIKKFTDPQNVKRQETAIEFYTSFAKGEQRVWDETLDESVLAFARGDLALFFGYSWDVFRIQTINKNLRFKIYPVPGLQGGKNATIASYWVEGASAKGKNQKEALLFMKYLAQPETSRKLFAEQSKLRAFGEPYARADLIETLKNNELVYPFVSQLPYAKSTYFASDTHDGEGGLNSALNAYLGNAVNAVAGGEQSTPTTVKTLNSGVSQVYKKYGIQ
jgi:multiple sugar transport system substrate-binding protein